MFVSYTAKRQYGAVPFVEVRDGGLNVQFRDNRDSVGLTLYVDESTLRKLMPLLLEKYTDIMLAQTREAQAEEEARYRFEQVA